MRRRTLLPRLAALPLGLAGGTAIGRRSSATMTLEEIQRHAVEWQAQAVAALPYERIEVDGRDALATVERLRASGRGWPVVVGDENGLARIAEPFGSDGRSPADILAAAAALEHPRDLLAYKADEERRSEQALAQIPAEQALGKDQPEQGNGYILNLLRFFGVKVLTPDVPLAFGPTEPEVGPWPTEPPWLPGLTVAQDLRDQPFAKVHILMLPTDEGASVPAYLRWGGWNANPLPEYHVAALRSWRERYGAELVGLSGDVMNLRVARRPAAREEALSLAREQHGYCNDIVDQGTGTLAPVAASLMASDWWCFWWD